MDEGSGHCNELALYYIRGGLGDYATSRKKDIKPGTSRSAFFSYNFKYDRHDGILCL